MHKIQAVLFDMDGLLLDTERIVQLAWNQAGEAMGYGKIGESIVETIGLNRSSRDQYFKSKYGEDFPFDVFSQLSTEAFVKYKEENGISVKPGAVPLLSWLSDRKIKMAVATSSSEGYAASVLDEAGLLPFFQRLICGNMVKRSKPEPDIYLTACEALQVDPTRAMALEDSPFGLESAWRAGVLPIMIPDLVPYKKEYEKYTKIWLPSLYEVISFLEESENG